MPPAGKVCTGGSSLLDPFQYARHIHAVIAQAGNPIGVIVIAVPAVLGTIPIVHDPAIERIGGTFQKRLGEINRIVQVVVIHVSNINM